jgi:hypothetical protein
MANRLEMGDSLDWRSPRSRSKAGDKKKGSGDSKTNAAAAAGTPNGVPDKRQQTDDATEVQTDKGDKE